MAIPKTQWNKADHDLLIEMRVELTGIRSDIREMKDTTASEVKDHEVRLRFIERYMWLAIGILTCLEFGLNFYSNYH